MKNYILTGTLCMFLFGGCGEHAHDHEHEGHDHEAEIHAEEKTAHSDEIALTPEKAKAAGVESEVIHPGAFREVIQAGGQILSAQGQEATVVAASSGVVSFSRKIAEGIEVGQGSELLSVSAEHIQEGDPVRKAKVAYEILRSAGVPCLISQYRYSMFDRAVEEEVLPLAAEQGSGFIAFSPLAQGLLTNKYLHGIPEHSRAARATGFLKVDQVTEDKVEKARRLNEVAVRRGQTLAEMALAWVLKDERMTSVIVGASSVKQLADNLHALDNLAFTDAELTEIEGILRL